MSRGFVKEDDQEELPLVPPRADLPAGIKNLVTPAGLKALQEEKKELEREFQNLDSNNEREKRIAGNFIQAKMKLLDERIGTAQVVEPAEEYQEVKFGAQVTFRMGNSNATKTYQLVGADEADPSQGKISFASPIAKTLIGKKQGEIISLNTPKGEMHFEIIAIH